MGEIIEVQNNEIEKASDEQLRVVNIDLTTADKGNAAALLSQVVEWYQVIKDKATEIEPEKRYYLDLTKEMKDRLEKSECWFTEKKESGRKMGQLRHMVDGKNEILANPDIIEEQITAGVKNNTTQLTNSIYQMALQQQMADLSHQMDQILKIVNKIEGGQLDDRIAKIEASEKTLRLAYAYQDEKRRKELVSNAIPMLEEGSESIKKTIKRRLGEFEAIPDKGRSLRLKMWMSPTNYVEKKNKEFDELQTCFEYYDKAQKLLAVACMMAGEPRAMEEVFFQQEKFIKSLNTSKLKSMEHLHYNIDFTNEWFYTPERFLDETRLLYLDLSQQNYNVVSLEVTGQQMLEVMDYDKDAGSDIRTEEK